MSDRTVLSTLAVVGASLLLGGLTSWAQGLLPDALASFANSPSGWTVLTALVVAAARPTLACAPPGAGTRRRRAAAGIVGLTPHDLRHTAASLAIAAGANVKAAQRMLGHSSAAMTLDIYAGLFGDDLDTVAALLDSHVPQMRHGGQIEAPQGGRNDAA